MTSNDDNSLNSGLQQAIDLYHAGRIDEALKAQRRLSKSHPGSPQVWGYLGFLNHESGRFDPASKAFAKAVQLSPHSEKASLGLFFALWRLGNGRAALKEMGRFIVGADPKGYLDLMLPALRAPAKAGTLRPSEIKKAEAAYEEVELHWDEMVTEINNPAALLDLVDA